MLAITTGIVAAYLTDYALTGKGGWRWMFGLGVVPAIGLTVGMWFLPDSPRWLISKSRTDEAQKALARLRSPEEIGSEVADIEQSTGKTSGDWKTVLFQPSLRMPLMIGIGLALFQQLSGINTAIYYAPTILKFAGFQSSGASILAAVGLGVVMLCSHGAASSRSAHVVDIVPALLARDLVVDDRFAAETVYDFCLTRADHRHPREHSWRGDKERWLRPYAFPGRRYRSMANLIGGTDSRRTALQKWLRIDPLNKPKVYEQVYETADFTNLNYWLGIVFSAGIATLGLVQNSPAVIIGAMLISPLMGPIMATGLGLAVGDFYLALKAIGTLVASIAVAVGLSALIVWILPFHSETGEILARTNPTLLDLAIALFSGLAGSVVVGRAGGSDGVTALPGVAIAVALMPPLCTMGFGMGSGWNMRILGGAGLLFLTNLVAIVSSAFIVFLLIGMNAQELAAQMEKCREGELLAQKLRQGRAAQSLMHTGRLRWRFLVLIVLLGAIAVPLKKAFVQVTGEAIARNAVQQVVKHLLPPGALVSQQVDVEPNSISVRLFSTAQIPVDKQKQAEQTIQERSGRNATLTVATVASQSQLAQMMERLHTTAPLPAPPAAAPVATIDEIRAKLFERISPVLTAIWPTEVPLLGFDIRLSNNGVALNAQYRSNRYLSPIALEMITKQLQDKLALPTLEVEAHRVRVTRKHTSERKTEAQ
jgi:uncharacterized hydrophobic protein (TIGR00271 family)